MNENEDDVRQALLNYNIYRLLLQGASNANIFAGLFAAMRQRLHGFNLLNVEYLKVDTRSKM